MIKVLFICHGNICRSTLAQSFFTHLVNTHGLADQFVIDSCATSREEIGNPPHRGTVNKLKEMGIPVVPHQARQITWSDYTNFAAEEKLQDINNAKEIIYKAIFIVCSREIRIKKYPNY